VFLQMIQRTGGIAMRVDGEDASEKLVMMLNHIKGRYVVGVAPAVVESALPQVAAFHSLKLRLTPEAMKRYGQVSIASTQGYYPVPGEQPDSGTSPGKHH